MTRRTARFADWTIEPGLMFCSRGRMCLIVGWNGGYEDCWWMLDLHGVSRASTNWIRLALDGEWD